MLQKKIENFEIKKETVDLILNESQTLTAVPIEDMRHCPH